MMEQPSIPSVKPKVNVFVDAIACITYVVCDSDTSGHRDGTAQRGIIR